MCPHPSQRQYPVLFQVVPLHACVRADDDNIIAKLGPKDWFGHEEILSNSRRAFTASSLKGETFCIRVPVEEYRKVGGGLDKPSRCRNTGSVMHPCAYGGVQEGGRGSGQAKQVQKQGECYASVCLWRSTGRWEGFWTSQAGAETRGV